MIIKHNQIWLYTEAVSVQFRSSIPPQQPQIDKRWNTHAPEDSSGVPGVWTLYDTLTKTRQICTSTEGKPHPLHLWYWWRGATPHTRQTIDYRDVWEVKSRFHICSHIVWVYWTCCNFTSSPMALPCTSCLLCRLFSQTCRPWQNKRQEHQVNTIKSCLPWLSGHIYDYLRQQQEPQALGMQPILRLSQNWAKCPSSRKPLAESINAFGNFGGFQLSESKLEFRTGFTSFALLTSFLRAGPLLVTACHLPQLGFNKT